MTNIDLNNTLFQIGYKGVYSDRDFMGHFLGNNYTIGNAVAPLFGRCEDAVILDLNLTFTTDFAIQIKTVSGVGDQKMTSFFTISGCAREFGGLIEFAETSTVQNVHVVYSCTVNVPESFGGFGGLIGQITTGMFVYDSSATGCTVVFAEYGGNLSGSGGIVAVDYGSIYGTKIERCFSDIDFLFSVYNPGGGYAKGVGGICGTFKGVASECLYTGTISSNIEVYAVYAGGLAGMSNGSAAFENCLFQGNISFTTFGNTSIGTMVAGFVARSESAYSGYQCINNGFLSKTGKKGFGPAGSIGYNECSAPCIFNVDRISFASSYSSCSGETSDADMKLRTTYSDWDNFDKYWIISPKFNDGFPMLKCFTGIAPVTDFDGSGSSTNPFLIKTPQDLLAMASYYNDNDSPKSGLYWELANNIDMSGVDSFTPICYNKEFDGYFDGQDNDIVNLLIDSQYEYTGLFGTIGSGGAVKDLDVYWPYIYWDQAYAVGFVAGRVLSDGRVSYCDVYDGKLIGVLNTKTSTECHGAVGKFEVDCVLNDYASYYDIKYAKMDSSSTTYYLYDWSYITTNLYDYKKS